MFYVSRVINRNLVAVNPQRIQFIYFDLDDTLLDHRQAEQRGLADVYQAFETHFDHVSLDAVHEAYHAHSVPLWRQYAHGEIGKHDLMRLRFERTLQTLAVKGLEAEALNRIYLNHYARHWTFPEAARHAFHTLADQFPIGILTNGFAEIQRAKFDRFPALRDRTEVLIISEEVGFMKPHPRIFAHAAGAAGAPPEALLYIGDSYSSDVQGALKAGWQSAWYTPQKNEAEPSVFQFQHWDALMKCLLETG